MRERIFLAFAVLAVSVVPALMGAAVHSAWGGTTWMPGTADGWLAFAGAFIGGLFTLTAGVIAWLSVKHEIAEARADALLQQEAAHAIIRAYATSVQKFMTDMKRNIEFGLNPDENNMVPILASRVIATTLDVERISPSKEDAEHALQYCSLPIISAARRCIDAEIVAVNALIGLPSLQPRVETGPFLLAAFDTLPRLAAATHWADDCIRALDRHKPLAGA